MSRIRTCQLPNRFPDPDGYPTTSVCDQLIQPSVDVAARFPVSAPACAGAEAGRPFTL
jgi:hypothetical protein